MSVADVQSAVGQIARIFSVQNDLDVRDDRLTFIELIREKQKVARLDRLEIADILPVGLLAVAGDEVARAVEQLEDQRVIDR